MNRLNRGLTPAVAETTDILLLNSNDLVIPMVEAKMEQVIKRSCRASCFTDPSLKPVGRPLEIMVYSRNFQLVDATGKPLDPSGDVIPITALPGQPPPSVGVIITTEVAR